MTPSPDPAQPARTSVGGGEVLLLAEDEHRVRKFVRDVLAAAGYTVLEASSGEEAVRLADAHTGRLHLLVTDVVMPGMGGRAAAERVAGRHPGVKVLYVSGYTGEPLDAGAAFLPKPFTPAQLAAKVRAVLDGTG